MFLFTRSSISGEGDDGDKPVLGKMSPGQDLGQSRPGPGPMPFTSLDLSFLFCPENFRFHDPIEFLTPT